MRRVEFQWPDRVNGVWDALLGVSSGHEADTAFVFGSEQLTFAAVIARAAACSAALSAAGVGRGSRVAVGMSACVEWASLFFALTKLGAVALPLNTRHTPAEALYELLVADAEFLVLPSPRQELDRPFATALADAVSPGPGSGDWFVRPPTGTGTVPDLLIGRLGGVHGWEPHPLAEPVLPTGRVLIDRSPGRRDDPFLITFTSGSTGNPKGALLRQWPAVRTMSWCYSALGLSRADRFFSPLPFHHAGGFLTAMLFPALTGGAAVIQSRWDPVGALDAMERHGCTVTIGHQPHWVEYLAACQDRPMPVERAATLAPAGINRQVTDKLGLTLVSLYGMTELHLAGAIADVTDPEAVRLETVGRPYPGVELSIVDQLTGRACAPGEAGEIRFRGWPVVDGYINDPGATRQAIDSDGWYRTGDLGQLDPDGNLRLRGRVKEMIRVGGENVSPNEVEAVLMSHPAVRQAVVGGAPDARLGEVCAAAVELAAPGAATEAQLIEWSAARLARFKVPRRITLVTNWPMAGPGKIARAAVRESLASGPPSAASSGTASSSAAGGRA